MRPASFHRAGAQLLQLLRPWSNPPGHVSSFIPEGAAEAETGEGQEGHPQICGGASSEGCALCALPCTGLLFPRCGHHAPSSLASRYFLSPRAGAVQELRVRARQDAGTLFWRADEEPEGWQGAGRD